MITVVTSHGNFDTGDIGWDKYGINIITGGRRLFIPYGEIIRIEFPAVQ